MSSVPGSGSPQRVQASPVMNRALAQQGGHSPAAVSTCVPQPRHEGGQSRSTTPWPRVVIAREMFEVACIP